MNHTDNDQTTYHEQQIGKILYCVTNVHSDELELPRAFEELIVRKILRDERA